MSEKRRLRRKAKEVSQIKPVKIGEGKGAVMAVPSQKNENLQKVAQLNATRLIREIETKEEILRGLWIEAKGLPKDQGFLRKVWSLPRMQADNLAYAADIFTKDGETETLAFTMKFKRDELIGVIFRVEADEKKDSIFWKKQKEFFNLAKK